MRRITKEDRIDDLLSAGTLAEAESLFSRAELVIKLRRKMVGNAPSKVPRMRKPKADQPSLPLAE